MPINRNKVVQTGANSQLGGLKDGLFKVGYQVLTAEVVKNDPITPAISQTTMLIINLPKFFINLIYFSSFSSSIFSIFSSNSLRPCSVLAVSKNGIAYFSKYSLAFSIFFNSGASPSNSLGTSSKSKAL